VLNLHYKYIGYLPSNIRPNSYTTTALTRRLYKNID